MNRRRFAVSLVLLSVALAAFAEPPRIRMFELYKEDLSFSDTAKRLNGKIVSMQGFMAPHLKVESDFFVLSNSPVETCPFCESEDQWIDTIIFVRMKKRQEAVNPGELKAMAQSGKTVVTVTHDERLAALADSVLAMKAGQVLHASSGAGSAVSAVSRAASSS